MQSCNFLITPTESGITSPLPTYPEDSVYQILQITPRPDQQLCWDPITEGYINLSWKEQKENIPIDSGIGGGMGEGDLSGSAYIGWSTFEVEPEVPIKGHYHLLYPKTSQNTLPITLRYMLILDEVQLIGAINDSTGPYQDVTLQPGDEITLTLKIPALSPGIHDFVILGLGGVQNEPDPYGQINFASNRYTLFAGNTTEVFPRTFQTLPKQGSLAKNDPLLSLELSLAGEYPFTVWHWPETYFQVSEAEPVNYYVFTSYSIVEDSSSPNAPIPEEVPFALVTFLDYQQVDFAPEQPVFYGSVLEDTAFTSINAHTEPISELGKHDWLVLQINYPGLPMCILQGPSDGYIFDHFLKAKRVGIEVIQDP
jgi:hypothetical protein